MKKLNRREFIKLLLVACAAPVVLKLPKGNVKSRVIHASNATVSFGGHDLRELAKLSSAAADTSKQFESLVKAIEKSSRAMDGDRVIASARHGVRKLYVSDAYKRYAEAAGHESLTEVEKQIAIIDYIIDNNGHLC